MLFQQPHSVGDADHTPVVVATDDQRTTFGIGEAAHPAQMIVAPGFLPFGALGLPMHESNQPCPVL
jgi:hypothetical protein